MTLGVSYLTHGYPKCHGLTHMKEFKEQEALDHIGRNGSLLWMECSAHEAQQLFNSLQSKGLIERNVWSGEWTVKKHGQS